MSKTAINVLYNGYPMNYLCGKVRGDSRRRVRTVMKALVRQCAPDVRNGQDVEILVPCGRSRGNNYHPYWRNGTWW